MRLYPRHDCTWCKGSGKRTTARQYRVDCDCLTSAAMLTARDIFVMPEPLRSRALAELNFPSAEPETVMP